MKFKFLKSVVLFGTIISLLLSGCGSGKGGNSGNIANDVNLKGDGLAAYDKTVKITYPSVTWSGVNYAEGESISDNLVTRVIKEKLNISWEPAFNTDTSGITSQLNLSLTTDNLPDVFYTDNSVLIKQLISTNAVEPLNDVIDRYATENLKAIMGFNNGRQYDPVTVDGKIYACPAPEDALNRVPVVYIRTDWMNKLGLKAPETLDDILNIAYGFVNNDPDGNGKKDTYGIPMDSYFGFVGTTMYTFANPNGAYWDQWVEKDGRLVYGSIQPEMKNTLSMLANAYSKGLINPKFEKASLKDDLANGKYGIFTGVFHSPTNYLKTHYAKYGADWSVYPIPKQSNGKYSVQIDLASRNYIFVKKGFKNPEALIKTLNLYAELNDGSMSEWWIKQQNDPKYSKVYDSFHMYLVPCQFASPMGNYDLGIKMSKALKENDTSVLTSPLEKDIYEKIKAGGEWGWSYKKYTADVMPVISNYIDNFHYSAYSGPITQTEMNKRSSLENYEKSIFLDIVSGRKAISSFDTFVEQWNKLGGADWTKEVNDWYQSKK